MLQDVLPVARSRSPSAFHLYSNRVPGQPMSNLPQNSAAPADRLAGGRLWGLFSTGAITRFQQ
ncbi:hypothetical protein THTE_0706 [Thermogutta terrifontis]|uniref:Uncharacterized protein n=1 Tax=Thermogutta terrifontis TaxID=1331910 RepID=A0A286RBG6_9BACT|nr:hypothetical protein THTE_0706 [Thermogutta terrifontis]